MAKRWTEEEMERLRALWRGELSLRVIGGHMGRSAEAIFRKAKDLGLGSKPYEGNKSPYWALIVRICQDGRARTVHELAAETGASRFTVDGLMKQREAAGLAHVVRWERRWGPPTPYWLPQPGASARKPKARTHNERQKALMRRMKDEDPLKYKAIIERKTLRRAQKLGVVPRQHAVVQAMYGIGSVR